MDYFPGESDASSSAASNLRCSAVTLNMYPWPGTTYSAWARMSLLLAACLAAS
jgi:hypothetical protein